MNVKKWIIASIVILVVDQALGWLIHGVMLSDMYKATSELWRSTAEMTSMMWMMIVTSLVWAFIFVYIFAKGYQGKGIMEGVRFGLIMGVFFSLPMSLGTYASMPIGFGLAAAWFISGIIVITIHGVIAALIYKPKTE